MKHAIRFLQLLYVVYAYLLFFILLMVVFPLAILASVGGVISGGNFLLWVCKWWARVWYFFAGIRHINIYESKPDRHQQYIFVANHISYLDAPCIVNTLHQPFRPLGKIEMVNYPLFGAIYKRVVVTVDRSSPQNRGKSVRRLKAVLRRGISIFIFPEGTFNETGKPLRDFYDGAFRLAIETQTPIQPVLFLDTYRLMHYRHLATIRPGKERSVFLEPVPVKGLSMEDVPALKQKVFTLMETKLIQYKADWIRKGHPHL